MFAVDDDLEASAKHEALDELPAERRSRAFEAWLRLGAACRKRGNGGLVTSALLAKILHSWKPAERARAAVDLVEAKGGREHGLWVVDGEAFRFHGWEAWQPTVAEAAVERAGRTKAAERSRRYRMRKRLGDASTDTPAVTPAPSRVTVPDTPNVTPRDVTQTVTEASRETPRDVPRARDPVPSRPDPSHPVMGESGSALAAFDDAITPIERARSALTRFYADRYQRETRDAWMGASGNADRITTAAAWCATQPDPIDAARRVVDGAFATERFARHRWPWKYIAEDPAACAAASTAPHTTNPPSVAGIPRIEVP